MSEFDNDGFATDSLKLAIRKLESTTSKDPLLDFYLSLGSDMDLRYKSSTWSIARSYIEDIVPRLDHIKLQGREPYRDATLISNELIPYLKSSSQFAKKFCGFLNPEAHIIIDGEYTDIHNIVLFCEAPFIQLSKHLVSLDSLLSEATLKDFIEEYRDYWEA